MRRREFNALVVGTAAWPFAAAAQAPERVLTIGYKALGVDIPPLLLAGADEVIE